MRNERPRRNPSGTLYERMLPHNSSGGPWSGPPAWPEGFGASATEGTVDNPGDRRRGWFLFGRFALYFPAILLVPLRIIRSYYLHNLGHLSFGASQMVCVLRRGEHKRVTMIHAPTVLVAIDPQMYRQVIAHFFRQQRPRAEVRTAEPRDLNG